MPGYFVFVRFFLHYTDLFPFAEVASLRREAIGPALEAIADEWWADDAHRTYVADLLARREQRIREWNEGAVAKPTHRKIEDLLAENAKGEQGVRGTPRNRRSQRPVSEQATREPPEVRQPDVQPQPSVQHHVAVPPSDDTAAERRGSPPSASESARRPPLARIAEYAGWNLSLPVDDPTYGICDPHPVAHLDREEDAAAAAEALRMAGKPLSEAYESPQQPFFAAINPYFFVVSEASLSPAELLLVHAQLTRLHDLPLPTAPIEEAYLRLYWPHLQPVLTVLAAQSMPTIQQEQSAEESAIPGKPPPEARSPFPFSLWALAYEADTAKWHIFRHSGDHDGWTYAKAVDIPAGNQSALLEGFLSGHGALKVEDACGILTRARARGDVKREISKLRGRIRKAVEAGQQDDPIPWMDRPPTYRLLTQIGATERENHGRMKFSPLQ